LRGADSGAPPVPIEVTLPKLSPTMENGQLVKWLVKVGDAVKEGDTLAEVQTDKAVMPMEAFDEGVVALLDAQEGEELALGQRVMVLAQKGEDPKQVAQKYAKGAAPAKADGGSKGQDARRAAPEPSAPTAQEPNRSGKSAATAADHSGGNGRDDSREHPGDRRIKASPLARKVAQAAGVDLARVRGSGPGGRIVRADVEQAAKAGPAATPTRAAAAARQTERIPHTRMRQTIAQRMVQAKQAAPEIHVTVEIRMDRVLAAREQLNKQLARENLKLSVGDFVTKAVALALRQHPAVNASWEPDAIVRHGEINIGIAVALEDGLIVPVLANADQLGLREIRQGTQTLADAARQNKLTPKQLMGGTFTISNLGMYGVKQFDAILNPPEVGILAVGATEPRPVVENGQLVAGQAMTVTLTADHRAVDGATAAEFLRTLKGLLEEPAAMLL
jgi:pyruvate dehydrogenase E2 component (dihydrolipoamide acetyltransferase)